MPTINDIAAKLGVSKSTVSKALNNAADVSETLKKRILETAVEIGYEKNRIRKDSLKKLCIIVENMDYENPMGFGYELVIGFKQLAIPAGWEVDTIPMTEELQKTVSYDMFMLENKYQGAFIVGFSLLDPWMKDFKSSHTPAVLYDNYIPENPRIAYVGVNNDEGFDMAIAHLKSLGHKTIGYLGGSLESHVTISRYNAYLHSMEKHGLYTDKSLTGCSYFISECTQKYLPVLLNKHVTAILCSHDSLANAVMTHCMELKYNVPDDISIIGFDDAPFSAYTMPGLTTIRQDRNALGRCGYYALSSLLNKTSISSLLLRAEFIERGSTSRVKNIC